MTDLPCKNRAAYLAKSTLGRLYGNSSFTCQSPWQKIAGLAAGLVRRRDLAMVLAA